MVDGAGNSSIFVLANAESILSDIFERAENNLKGKWGNVIGFDDRRVFTCSGKKLFSVSIRDDKWVTVPCKASNSVPIRLILEKITGVITTPSAGASPKGKEEPSHLASSASGISRYDGKLHFGNDGKMVMIGHSSATYDWMLTCLREFNPSTVRNNQSQTIAG